MEVHIINSLLTQDLYSFSQQQAILHHFPDVFAEYEFKCRNLDAVTSYFGSEDHINQINMQIDHLCSLRLSKDELNYLSSIYFLKPSYIEFLKNFQLQRDNINVYLKDNELKISIKGYMFQTILFEVPILAIVNETYFNSFDHVRCLKIGRERLLEKISYTKRHPSAGSFQFADFGLRRRFSSDWQDGIVGILKTELPMQFIGTSNVYLAKKYNVKPIGTMSHQFIQLGQGLDNVRLSESQKYMLDLWVREYRGDLGIALSDTLGFDAFLRDFDKFFAKLYDGCRHDSGDPYLWGEKLIAHYEKLGIDPKTKSAIFSDGLTFQDAMDLHLHFKFRIKTSFGIGTHLTNDCGETPLQIVIKLVQVNGNPVAKISDSKGKGMCDDVGYLRYLKSVFKIE